MGHSVLWVVLCSGSFCALGCLVPLGFLCIGSFCAFELGSFRTLGCFEFGSFQAWLISLWVILILGCLELGSFRDGLFLYASSIETIM